MQTKTTYNASELNYRIGTRKNLYDILSQHYFLPAYNSHACTVSYLKKYIEEPIQIYTCEIKSTPVFKPRFREKNVMEMFEVFEEFLKSKQKLPTGMTHLELPDLDWLATVIHKEDPDDTLSLFKDKTVPNDPTTQINAK